jgi:hypothetical protein
MAVVQSTVAACLLRILLEIGVFPANEKYPDVAIAGHEIEPIARWVIPVRMEGGKRQQNLLIATSAGDG